MVGISFLRAGIYGVRWKTQFWIDDHEEEHVNHVRKKSHSWYLDQLLLTFALFLICHHSSLPVLCSCDTTVKPLAWKSTCTLTPHTPIYQNLTQIEIPSAAFSLNMKD